MKNVLKKYNPINIDENQIDTVSLYESLLRCLSEESEFICNYIDREINDIAFMPYSLGRRAIEQYDTVLELTNAKVQIINLYVLFGRWYKALDDKRKKLYVKYFVKQDGKLCEKAIKMIESFKTYITVMSEYEKTELIKNPFIYDWYLATLRKNEHHRKNGLKNKGGNKSDCTANEGCDCQCV